MWMAKVRYGKTLLPTSITITSFCIMCGNISLTVVLQQQPRFLLCGQGLHFTTFGAPDSGFLCGDQCGVRRNWTGARECKLMWSFVWILQTCFFQTSIDGLPDEREEVGWECWTGMHFKLLHGIHQCDWTCDETNGEFQIVLVEPWLFARHKLGNLPWKLWLAWQQWYSRGTEETNGSPSLWEGY